MSGLWLSISMVPAESAGREEVSLHTGIDVLGGPGWISVRSRLGHLRCNIGVWVQGLPDGDDSIHHADDSGQLGPNKFVVSETLTCGVDRRWDQRPSKAPGKCVLGSKSPRVVGTRCSTNITHVAARAHQTVNLIVHGFHRVVAAPIGCEASLIAELCEVVIGREQVVETVPKRESIVVKLLSYQIVAARRTRSLVRGIAKGVFPGGKGWIGKLLGI